MPLDGRSTAEVAADPLTPAGTALGVDGTVGEEGWKKRGVPVAARLRGECRGLLLSPINGLLGIQDAETGHVGPFNSGTMFGSVMVFLYILAIGGFMTVVSKTGSLDLGISHLARRFSTRGPLLIIVLSVLFGVLGSTMSWSDETLGFYALIPLMLALGYDRVVTVAVVTVAPFAGSIGATVNPFRIGTGSDAAGVSMGRRARVARRAARSDDGRRHRLHPPLRSTGEGRSLVVARAPSSPGSNALTTTADAKPASVDSPHRIRDDHDPPDGNRRLINRLSPQRAGSPLSCAGTPANISSA